jgi:hypothetical protein
VKVNLLIGGTDIRNGWTNIDMLAGPSETDRMNGDVGCLDSNVDDAEAAEIVALDIIDFLPVPLVFDALDNWAKKLRHSGTLTIGGVDLREVAKAVSVQQIGINDANAVLYGDHNEPYKYRKSAFTLQYVIQLLQLRGLETVSKQIKNLRYCVTVRRP